MLKLDLRRRLRFAWAEAKSRPSRLRGVSARYHEAVGEDVPEEEAIAGAIQGLLVDLRSNYVISPKNEDRLLALLREGGPEEVETEMVNLRLTLTWGTSNTSHPRPSNSERTIVYITTTGSLPHLPFPAERRILEDTLSNVLGAPDPFDHRAKAGNLDAVIEFAQARGAVAVIVPCNFPDEHALALLKKLGVPVIRTSTSHSADVRPGLLVPCLERAICDDPGGMRWVRIFPEE
ncbi:MAG: hypothetical protein OEV37_00035 [Candidatus Berkelbacteria bacterium]|nr:hypothetical protein [Candidatus Berkelbacteria bacterium]